ncbi:MAG: amidohydrolase [Solirubrobacteraceae bacterium]|nr:amidohydrolase [Patulibacter sp.]
MSTASDTDLTAALERVAPTVVEWRRHLHAHPELSHHEHATAAWIADRLTDLGLEPSHPTPTSAVATLTGALPGRTIAVRADIDALPITEDTGLPFASTNPGVMHACGHDGHTAVVLGVATVLAERRDQLRGSVRFVFQHSEETTPKGAPQLIAAGVLDGVDAIIGEHLWAPLPVGVIGINHGGLMASSDAFRVYFTGRGGHGGMPHDTIESIPAAADFIQATQRLVAREFAAEERVVVSVTQLQAGEVYNVIPGETFVGGTARALTPEHQQRLVDRLHELAADIARLHRVEARVEYVYGPPPLINHPEVVDVIAASAGPGDEVREIEPTMGGDDFADYLLKIPGSYVFVGATEPTTDPVYPHHHPKFDISERALPIATGLLTRAALTLGERAWPTRR